MENHPGPTLPDRQTLSTCKALTDHLDQRIRTISTTSIADTITTAYEEDTDTQDNDPIADMDKATTVEATGPQAIATTPLATPIAIGPKSALFVDKKVAEERQEAKDQYVAHCQFTGIQPPNFIAYLIDYEGHELDELTTDDIWEEPDNGTNNHPRQWRSLPDGSNHYQYSVDNFPGIMIDTAGHSQYIALQREDPSVALDSSTSGQATITFGHGEATHSIGSIALKTPVGRITFHILQTPTQEEEEPPDRHETPAPHKRGRPPGSKNKPQPAAHGASRTGRHTRANNNMCLQAKDLDDHKYNAPALRSSISATFKSSKSSSTVHLFDPNTLFSPLFIMAPLFGPLVSPSLSLLVTAIATTKENNPF
ncbi:hypothetical protein HRG_013037 [Hirsutella rhossiliensis]